MAGRPTKFTPEIVEEIIGSIAAGLTDKDAALASGITEATLGRWREKYVDFDSRITRAKAERARTWLIWMRQKAKAGDVKAISELLDRCAPEYRKTTHVNVSGADGGPLVVSVIRDHAPESD